jgi:hypothetical protein
LSPGNIKIALAEFIGEIDTEAADIPPVIRFLVKCFCIINIRPTLCVKDVIDVKAE